MNIANRKPLPKSSLRRAVDICGLNAIRALHEASPLDLVGLREQIFEMDNAIPDYRGVVHSVADIRRRCEMWALEAGYEAMCEAREYERTIEADHA